MNATKSNTYFGLDHLRALAITLVFLFHYGRIFPHPQWVNDICLFGWTGVDLFFVLSGFLIARQLFEQLAKEGTISVKEFYIKRFFRIIPAYLIVVAIYYFVPAFREREALGPVWKFLTFTRNLGLNLRLYGTFSHSWSLCIEEQFYLFLPLIIILFIACKQGKKAFYLLLLLFVLGFVCRVYSWNRLVVPFIDTDDFMVRWFQYVYYPTYNRLDGLLVGIAIAGIFQFLPTLKSKVDKYGTILLISSMVLIVIAYFLCLEQTSFAATVYGFPLVAIAYGVLTLAALSASSVLYRIHSTFTSTIATLSYSIYLTHKGLIHTTQLVGAKVGLEVDSSLMFLLCIIVCICGAWILNKLVEQPFQKLRYAILNK